MHFNCIVKKNWTFDSVAEIQIISKQITRPLIILFSIMQNDTKLIYLHIILPTFFLMLISKVEFEAIQYSNHYTF